MSALDHHTLKIVAVLLLIGLAFVFAELKVTLDQVIELLRIR